MYYKNLVRYRMGYIVNLLNNIFHLLMLKYTCEYFQQNIKNIQFCKSKRYLKRELLYILNGKGKEIAISRKGIIKTMHHICFIHREERTHYSCDSFLFSIQKLTISVLYKKYVFLPERRFIFFFCKRCDKSSQREKRNIKYININYAYRFYINARMKNYACNTDWMIFSKYAKIRFMRE